MARVCTLDDVVTARESLEVGAGARAVLVAVDLEGTLDIAEVGERDAVDWVSKCRLSTRNLQETRKDLPGEVTVHGKSTADSCELGVGNNGVIGVVLNGESTSDGLEKGHADVGELVVAVESEGRADGGQVGSGDGGEFVLVESERAIDNLEGSEINGRNLAEGHVVGPDHVREDSSHVVAVGLDDERNSDVAELHLDVGKVRVVGNEDSVDNLEVDTVKRSKLGVLDVEGAGSLDTSGERQALEVGKGVPDDRIDCGELGEAEGGQDGDFIEVELAGDGLERVGGQLGHLGNIAGNQVSGNLLDSVEGNVVRVAGGNGDASSEGGAGSQGRSISGAGDGGSRGRARRSCAGVAVLAIAAIQWNADSLVINLPIALPAAASAGTMYLIDIVKGLSDY